MAACASSIALINRRRKQLNVSIIGDCDVGKTSLIASYSGQKWNNHYMATLGINFVQKSIRLHSEDVIVSIIDLGGRKEYKTMMPTACKDADIVLLSFNLIDSQSLKSVKKWYTSARRENKQFLPLLVGHKLDEFLDCDQEYRMMIEKKARTVAKKMRAPEPIYCSSKSGENMAHLMETICITGFRNEAAETKSMISGKDC